MPTGNEKTFFIKAFRLIDQQNGTNWAEVYSSLESASSDGQIDWRNIPGLLDEAPYEIHTGHGGKGYRKAVNRVVKTLVEYIKDDDTDPDLQLQVELSELVASARGIYQARRKALNLNRQIDEEAGDAGHDWACKIWQEGSELLQDAFELQQFNRYHPNGIQLRSDEQENPAVAIVAVGFAVLLAVGLIWWLVY